MTCTVTQYGPDTLQDNAAGVIPVGGGLDHYGSTPPVNYLALPLVPTNISRTTYAKLFAAIGTTWGAGNGSTTFGMPYCPANHATVQANGNVGTATVGENLAHTHSGMPGQGINQAGGSGIYVVQSDGSWATIGSSGGSANLPAGVRVLKCVRYK